MTAEPCPECRAGVVPRQLTNHDYTQALAMLAAREDLTQQQRQEAIAYLDRIKSHYEEKP